MISLIVLVYSVIGFFIFYNVAKDIKLNHYIKTSAVVKLTCLSILLGVGSLVTWIFMYVDCCGGIGRLFPTKNEVSLKQRIINWIEK